MSKQQPPKPPDASGLDPEEAALWEQVTGSAQPLRRGGERVRPQQTARPARAAAKPAEQRGRGPGQAAKPAPNAKAQPPGPPPLGRFDTRDARGLRSGRIDVDARLDLHGMRQREAHGALNGFLLRAQARGARLVLIITGKGAARSASDALPSDDSGGAGVLRRAVPSWLAEPAMRQVVVSFTPAGPRHGGDGALYVRLRKAGP